MNSLPRYLGLDIGTHTGWCVAEGDKIIGSGVRDFSVKASEHVGKRGIKFYNFIMSLGQVDEIYYEKINFGGGFKNKSGKWVNSTNDGREFHHGLMMLVNMYSASFAIPMFGIHPGTLKKDFTGSGTSKKKQMCAAAHNFGWKGGAIGTELCHDEADAIALLVTQLRNKYNIKLRF